ncbi:hypothetical protein I316_04541 [Kwoniella heveanensis BCC8398]|uniref:Uncharacterized protein n=1 Tax=Kwoniella heveanensis BCC8398 TaxID=1296120 RepID=A0A1B9GRX6_9TREE|nr:hypothetical protein I316_04541 [Kwoniella heveanensis BCC8398]
MSSHGGMSQGDMSQGEMPQDGQQIDIDSIVWSSLVSSPAKTTAMITASVISKTSKYFEHFQKTDSQALMCAIATGCVVTIAILALGCAQVYELIYHADSEFHTIFRFLMLSDQCILLIGGLFNLFAGSYYAYRAWRMVNSKWWIIPPFAIGLSGAFIACCFCVAQGFKMPHVRMDTLQQLPGFFERFIYLSRIWGGITLTIDLALCLCLTILLIRSKDSIFSNEQRLFHKLLALMYEAMLPPVILLFVLECTTNDDGSPTTDWRKFLTTCMGPLYFHSVLGALVSRQTIRGLLDNKLAVEGVNLLSGGTGGASRTFVGHSSITSKHAEEGGYELKSEVGSKVSVGGPMVKVEHNSSTSEPDAYAASHPHLSPTDDVSTVNRPHSNRLHSPIEDWENQPVPSIMGGKGWSGQTK